jgi:hypothetical protein
MTASLGRKPVGDKADDDADDDDNIAQSATRPR